MNFKNVKFLAGVLLAGSLLSTMVPTSYTVASSNVSEQNQKEELSRNVQNDVKEFQKKGYITSVNKDTYGITTISSYKLVTDGSSSSGTQASLITPQAEDRSAVISVNERIYYGYSYTADIYGTISYTHNTNGTVTITNHNLNLRTGYTHAVTGVSFSPQTGNPAIMKYNIKINQKVGYSTNYVPYGLYFNIYPNDTMKFSNDATYK